MKALLRTLPAVALLGMLSMSASAQTTYTVSEYPTPIANAQPLHVLPISPTQSFFTESAKNRIGLLDTNADTISEWILPAGGLPHGLVLDAAGNVAFCAYNGGYVGVLNTTATTSQLTRYAVPTPTAGVIHLDTGISAGGTPTYFFSEAVANKIGLLDVGAGQFTEWTLPTLNSNPRGVTIGNGTQVFFAELSAHKIGMLDTSTNNVTEWLIPSIRQVEHIHFNNGLIYFGDLGTSLVGVLDPVGSSVTLWQAPTVNANNPDVWLAGPSLMNFTERGGTKIGFLNTSTPGTIKAIKAVVSNVTPVVTAAVGSPVSLKTTSTAVTPTVNTVVGVVTGLFTEWPLPTPSSGPLGINGNGTSIFFAEYYGSKIGVFTPAGGSAKAK